MKGNINNTVVLLIFEFFFITILGEKLLMLFLFVCLFVIWCIQCGTVEHASHVSDDVCLLFLIGFSSFLPQKHAARRIGYAVLYLPANVCM